MGTSHSIRSASGRARRATLSFRVLGDPEPDSNPALHSFRAPPSSDKISRLGAPDHVSRHLHPLFPCGVAPGDAAIKDHPKYPLQTVFGTDCKHRGRSPRQPAGEGSVDSFLVSARFFLFSHFCCSHIAPARCRSRKETGKVKATHAQALPSPSRAPL